MILESIPKYRFQECIFTTEGERGFSGVNNWQMTLTIYIIFFYLPFSCINIFFLKRVFSLFEKSNRGTKWVKKGNVFQNESYCYQYHDFIPAKGKITWLFLPFDMAPLVKSKLFKCWAFLSQWESNSLVVVPNKKLVENLFLSDIQLTLKNINSGWYF